MEFSRLVDTVILKEILVILTALWFFVLLTFLWVAIEWFFRTGSSDTLIGVGWPLVALFVILFVTVPPARSEDMQEYMSWNIDGLRYSAVPCNLRWLVVFDENGQGLGAYVIPKNWCVQFAPNGFNNYEYSAEFNWWGRTPEGEYPMHTEMCTWDNRPKELNCHKPVWVESQK